MLGSNNINRGAKVTVWLVASVSISGNILLPDLEVSGLAIFRVYIADMTTKQKIRQIET